MADIEKDNSETKVSLDSSSADPVNSNLTSKKQHYMNNLNLDTKNSMKNRILVSIFLVLICVPYIVLGN